MSKSRGSRSLKMSPGALLAQFTWGDPSLSTPSLRSGKPVIMGTKHSAMTTDEFLKDLTVLPADIGPDVLKFLEQKGFRLHGKVSHNMLLRLCTFPKDWRKGATGNPACTHLIDPAGERWAEIFYLPRGHYRGARIKLMNRSMK